MTRSLTALQKSLAAQAWELSSLKAALLKQLDAVDGYQREAIALAAMHGVRQRQLALISGLTAARVSQIVAATPVEETAAETSPALWRQALDFSQDHLRSFRRISTAAEQELWNTRFESIHGAPGNFTISQPN